VHYVYVVECADGSFYTGYTTDPARRVAEHDAGEGAKYTRGRTPVELVHVESFDGRSAAMAREYELKQLSRRAKERLVEGDAGLDPSALDAIRADVDGTGRRDPDPDGTDGSGDRGAGDGDA
jgi:putative endonuclease